MTARDIVQKYDTIDCKGFDEYDIKAELESVPVEERNKLENMAEWTAFAFTEGFKTPWDTYYGPYTNTADASIYVPSKESITEEMLQYWYKRMEEVVNPMLKARYSGLLVDFMPKCNGTIRKVHLQSLLETVNGLYPSINNNCMNKLCHAYSIAVCSKNDDDIKAVIDCLVGYEQKIATDYDMGIWGRAFSLMLSDLKRFSNEEASFVKRMEERIARLMSMPIDGNKTERFDVGVIDHAVDLLAQYYHKKNNKGELLRVLNILFEAIHKSFPTMTTIHKDALLNRMCQLYNYYQFHAEEKVVLEELQQNSVKLAEELSMVSIPYEIPNHKLESYAEKITSGSFDEVVSNFIFLHTPNRKQSEEQLLKRVSYSPLFYMLPTSIIDTQGKPSSVIGNIQDDFEGNLIYYIYDSMFEDNIYLRSAIHKAEEKGVFTIESIMGYFTKSPFFNDDRLQIIKRGLIAYFDKDFLVSLHLLTPQIENIVKGIVEGSGRAVIKKKNNGYQNITLDDLLRNEAIEMVDDNLSLYLRILFTEQKGWNIRNTICHGMADQSFFNQAAADRVFHALLCLAAIRLAE